MLISETLEGESFNEHGVNVLTLPSLRRDKGRGDTVLNLSVAAPKEGVRDESQPQGPYQMHLICDFQHSPKAAGIQAGSLRLDDAVTCQAGADPGLALDKSLKPWEPRLPHLFNGAILNAAASTRPSTSVTLIRDNHRFSSAALPLLKSLITLTLPSRNNLSP